jgi:DNA-binding NarL/FixJ family response regulator
MRVVRAWDALTMPYHAAYARLHAAEAFVGTASDRSEATLLLREAVDTAISLRAEPLRQLIEGCARRCRVDLGVPEEQPADLGLTSREIEVLRVLASGATNRQIASTLYISEKTASVHVSNIIRKLSVANRSEAAATAVRAGLA